MGWVYGIRGSLIKNECTQLCIAECGDETPTVVGDTQPQSFLGTIHSSRIKSRDPFLPCVIVLGKKNKATTFSPIFHITEGSPFEETVKSFAFPAPRSLSSFS